MGVGTLDFFHDFKKGRGTASFDVFCVKIGAHVSAVAFLKNPHPKKVAESLCAEGREITHAQNRSPYTDLDKIWHVGRYRRRSYLHKFWVAVVKFRPLPLTFIVALTNL